MVSESEKGKDGRARKGRMGALEGEVRLKLCDKGRDPGEGSKVSLSASLSTQYFSSEVSIPSYFISFSFCVRFFEGIGVREE